ncbi:thioesterase family protein [Streptomyces litchfieldiae]|uniref:Thioesterase family protein n=1 Tax=Streptomyces litchfieldiae TaxID=3075543 RepID=A0ABU2MYV4_9ACTN|nr:thioesterase family protein [Streptomyces sp. DSM 44938]MDT0346453.1 thioesterase family protein [Streptomyces sp. DSM 44938]
MGTAAMLVIDRRSWGSGPGSHGGYLSARTLAAMRRSLDAGTRPVRALTTHFLSPVDDRPFTLAATVERAGRGSAVVTLRGEQGGRTALLASAAFDGGAPSRPGPAHQRAPAPDAPPPDACRPLVFPRQLAVFAGQFEFRPTTGARPLGGGPTAELVAWTRFTDRRPLDAEAVTVLTDALPPALYARWTTPRPMPTAELTVHFAAALDRAPATGWSLIRMRAVHADDGWALDDSAVWDELGRPLAVARQSRRIL